MPYNAIVNQIAVAFHELSPDMSRDVASGVTKLFLRNGVGITTTNNAGLILTQAEEAVLLRNGARFLVKLGARVWVFACIADAFVNVVRGEGERRTVQTRLSIIGANFLRHGTSLSAVFSTAEQICFIIHDAVVEEHNFVSMNPFRAPEERPGVFTLGFNALVSGINNLIEGPAAEPLSSWLSDTNVSIIEAPGFLVNPIQNPPPAVQVETFPLGPRPSFGRRR